MERADGAALTRLGISLGVVLVRRPRLVPAAVRLGLSLVPRRWWRRRPYLPLPDRDWVAFRMELAYGDARAIPSAEDLVDYLVWARQMRTLQGTGPGRRRLAR
jgi:hypothetical protein